MPKKAESQKDGVRLEIIKKARDVLSRFGFRGASTEIIAKSMNRTKGALYHYFRNRDDLIKAVIDYEAGRITQAVVKGLAGRKTPQARLFSYFTIRAAEVRKLFTFYGYVIGEYSERYEFITDALKVYSRQEIELVEGIISAGVRGGQFAAKNVNLASRMLIRAMTGFDFFLFHGQKYVHLEEEMREALSAMIRGISK